MKKFRLYYDKETETSWINKMCKDGWAFKSFFMGVYTFNPCTPGEYIYQIDLLDYALGSGDYKEFMKDTGVEVLSTWYRWIYLRKKASEGSFEMYTDVESKIQHYRKIKNFFIFFFILEVFVTIVEISSAIGSGNVIFWYFSALFAFIALIFLKMVWKFSWRIEELKR